MRKKYFKAYTTAYYISHKNNIAKLYFTLGTAKLHGHFTSILKDGLDINRFSNERWVLTMCTVGNLKISWILACKSTGKVST